MHVAGYCLSNFAFIPGLGREINGSQIWIVVPGLGMSFQPAELTKVLLSIFFASYLGG